MKLFIFLACYLTYGSVWAGEVPKGKSLVLESPKVRLLWAGLTQENVSNEDKIKFIFGGYTDVFDRKKKLVKAILLFDKETKEVMDAKVYRLQDVPVFLDQYDFTNHSYPVVMGPSNLSILDLNAGPYLETSIYLKWTIPECCRQVKVDEKTAEKYQPRVNKRIPGIIGNSANALYRIYLKKPKAYVYERSAEEKSVLLPFGEVEEPGLNLGSDFDIKSGKYFEFETEKIEVVLPPTKPKEKEIILATIKPTEGDYQNPFPDVSGRWAMKRIIDQREYQIVYDLKQARSVLYGVVSVASGPTDDFVLMPGQKRKFIGDVDKDGKVNIQQCSSMTPVKGKFDPQKPDIIPVTYSVVGMGTNGKEIPTNTDLTRLK